MSFFEETPRSLRIWLLLAGTIEVLAAAGILAGAAAIPWWGPLIGLLYLALGLGTLYVGVKVADLLKAGSPLPLRLVKAMIGLRLLDAVAGAIQGASLARALGGLAIPLLFFWYIYSNLVRLGLDQTDPAPELGQWLK